MTTKNMDWSDPALGQPHDPHRRIVMLGLASWATLGLQACGGGGGTTTPPKVAVVSTLAGSGAADWADGTGVDAKFNHPNGLALDTSGNVYVSDEFNHRIRIISTAGVVSNYAGSGNTNADGDGEFAEGTGTGASFFHPNGICLLTNGDLIVADYGNHLIRKVTPAGLVTSVAGSGEIDSSTPGNFGVFRDGTGSAAAFNCPLAVAVDTHGNIFVSDTYNHRIRKITWA